MHHHMRQHNCNSTKMIGYSICLPRSVSTEDEDGLALLYHGATRDCHVVVLQTCSLPTLTKICTPWFTPTRNMRKVDEESEGRVHTRGERKKKGGKGYEVMGELYLRCRRAVRASPMAVSLLLTALGPPRPDPHLHVASWPVWSSRPRNAPCVGVWPTGSAQPHRPCSPLQGLLSRICTSVWRRGRLGALAHTALPAWCRDRPGPRSAGPLHPRSPLRALSAGSTPPVSMETTREGELWEWRRRRRGAGEERVEWY
jgi:hypothetical protein